MSILSYALIAYALYGLCVGMVVVSHLRSTSRKRPSSFENANAQPQFFLMIPLLEEQNIFPVMYKRFKALADANARMRLFYVTTEREKAEGKRTRTIIDLLNAALYTETNERIQAIHYPYFNHVVAQQLNYAIAEVMARFGENPFHDFGIYNADTVPASETFAVLAETIFNETSHRVLYQQSSLCLANIPALINQRRYLLASFGLYQSLWTIRHEIPQYMFDRQLRQQGTNNELNLLYCVTHGLFIPFHAMTILDRLPEFELGCEDIACGYKAKLNGFTVVPLLVLENSHSPSTIPSLIMQLKQWYLGTLGYLSYWRTIDAKHSIRHHMIVTAQGIVFTP